MMNAGVTLNNASDRNDRTIEANGLKTTNPSRKLHSNLNHSPLGR